MPTVYIGLLIVSCAIVEYDDVPKSEPVNDVADNEPVKPYEPVNCRLLVHTLPDLTSKSPYELVVVVSRVSCNSPNSYPLSTRTCIDPLTL